MDNNLGQMFSGEELLLIFISGWKERLGSSQIIGTYHPLGSQSALHQVSNRDGSHKG